MISNFITSLKEKRLQRLEKSISYKKREMELRAIIEADSHSLLWVWEFSKKVVLICFLLYVAVQIYSMVVMIVTHDFTSLGDLITEAGQTLREGVIAYLIKAGIENIGKIWFTNKYKIREEDEIVG